MTSRLEGMGMGALSPALSFFDAVVGHANPRAGLPPDLCDWDAPAMLNVASLCELHARLFSTCCATLREVCGVLGLSLSCVEEVIMLHRDGEAVSNGHIRDIIREVEDALQAVFGTQMSDTHLILEKVADASMKSCALLIKNACKEYLSENKVGKIATFKVQPVAFASGNMAADTGFCSWGPFGMMTIPNYSEWGQDNCQYIEYKLRNVASEERRLGRVWRYEYWQVFRAPCHEVVHLVQHEVGQRMSSQIAEHDGYYSCHILAQAIAKLDNMKEFAYPGIIEDILLSAMFSAMIVTGTEGLGVRLDDAPAVGYQPVEYRQWRDSFGVGEQLWNDKNFNNDQHVESACGTVLTFEAVCPRGAVMMETEVDATVQGMLATFFKDRTEDCKEVHVDALVDLAGLAVEERLRIASTPVGGGRARDVMALLLDA